VFFDEYPRFLETSEVFARPGRLNLRHEAIVTANRDVLEGARVLDLASHDGRWSFAALQAGAKHVTGVESREEAVAHAYDNLAHYGADPDAYHFVCGDLFDVLRDDAFDVDVVMCLGFIYHTYRHTELMHHIRRLDPTYLLVDCTVVPNQQEPSMLLKVDHPHKPGDASLDTFAHGRRTLVARPSAPALRMMLRAYDFEIEQTHDWDSLMARHPEVGRIRDYSRGSRVTLRCRTGTSVRATSAPSPDDPRATAPAATPGVDSRNGAATTGAAQHDTAAGPPASGSRWRHLVNRSLARTTGYELRRTAHR
jgi:SAM-dependent methyltransferase